MLSLRTSIEHWVVPTYRRNCQKWNARKDAETTLLLRTLTTHTRNEELTVCKKYTSSGRPANGLWASCTYRMPWNPYFMRNLTQWSQRFTNSRITTNDTSGKSDHLRVKSIKTTNLWKKIETCRSSRQFTEEFLLGPLQYSRIFKNALRNVYTAAFYVRKLQFLTNTSFPHSFS